MMDSCIQILLTHSRTRVVFGAGSLDKLGELARSENARHVLLVTDPGIRRAGHADRAAKSLQLVGIHVAIFEGAAENPTTAHVDTGVAMARDCALRGEPIDFLVGLGGGSAMDCAKGINFIYTNGGRMQDYWGLGKAAKPMLPMIAIPTTAGTGSEAQSFALITDPATHQKMACGDPKAMCRVAILDPDLTRTQPAKVAAASGIDAVAHAVETAGCTKRTEVSLEFSREAWLRLDRAFERAMQDPGDDSARADMLLGAHLAGCAIEHSMLGAAHACANPLTARCGITHGFAVGAMLPHVVRFNSGGGTNPYASIANDAEVLVERLIRMLDSASLAGRLRDLDVKELMLPQLAAEAAEQWTAKFNPVAVGAEDLLAIYRAAW